MPIQRNNKQTENVNTKKDIAKSDCVLYQNSFYKQYTKNYKE